MQPMKDAGKEQKVAAPFPDFAATPDIVNSERIRRLCAYWDARRNGRLMPSRTDIDPAEMRDLLPNIVMVDIETPFRARYRLVGTKVVEFNRFDFTGRYMDELRWDEDGRYSRAYRKVVAEKVPLFGIDAWPLAGAMTGRSEVVILPLSSDGDAVDRCISMEDFLFAQHQMAPEQKL
jgi:hypothetical protein